jgi:hypothetical protein
MSGDDGSHSGHGVRTEVRVIPNVGEHAKELTQMQKLHARPASQAQVTGSRYRRRTRQRVDEPLLQNQPTAVSPRRAGMGESLGPTCETSAKRFVYPRTEQRVEG